MDYTNKQAESVATEGTKYGGLDSLLFKTRFVIHSMMGLPSTSLVRDGYTS